MATVARSTYARGLKVIFRVRQLLCVASVASGNTVAVGLLRPDDLKPTSFPMRYTASCFSSSSSSETSCQNSASDVLEVLRDLMSRLREPAPLRSSPHAADIATGDDASGLSLEDLAAKLCKEYPSLPPLTFPEKDKRGREAILEYLAMECGPSDQQVTSAVQHYQQHTPSEGNTASFRHHLQLISKLRQACTPQYESLFQCLLEENAQQALVLLVGLREDLNKWIQWQQEHSHSHDESLMHLRQLDTRLRNLFSTWFSPGMLEMRRITYENTSALIMEKIATKEAVHPVKSLEDLRTRLGPDRRVFAAFHPLLPDEPLVFVHVALRSFIPNSMDQVLEASIDTTAAHPRVATFYSISSTQAGLSGVDLGQFLLKRVVQELQVEFPELQDFVTLSPIPRFRKWLEEKIVHNKGKFIDDTLLTEDETERLRAILGCSSSEEVPGALLHALKETLPIKEHAKSLQNIFLRLAARYLVLEKHHGKPLDGVARFHIRNGAEMYRINYMADTSRKGWHNSVGMMINYRYNLKNLHENQVRYEEDYHIPVCEGVSQWLPQNT